MDAPRLTEAERPYGIPDAGAVSAASAAGSLSLGVEGLGYVLDGEIVIETSTGLIRLRFGESRIMPGLYEC